jgi:heat-inducible transcriptional repressor
MQPRLSPRKEAILRALVDEYIRTGEPVPSKVLADQLLSVYASGVSPATVRNELAALEAAGLILQPHVSAGRAPTDLGYRYFVERLMGESRLSLDEQRLIRHQFYQVQHQLDEWIRLTAAILAQALQSAAIITQPRADEARLKHFELLSLTDTVALLVLALEDGTVRQERLLLDLPMSQEELSRLTARLNERFRRATANDVVEWLESARLAPDERVALESLARLLARPDIFSPDSFHAEGITKLLQRREFSQADPERVRRVVEALEENSFLPRIARQALESDGVQVIIGAENESDAFKDMSVIVARYGVPGQLGGLLGVVSPTRMQYSRAIAVVRYMTEMLNDLLADAYDAYDTAETYGTPGTFGRE